MNNYPKRGEIYWGSLDPTVGKEINKKRPCLIISNDIGNEESPLIIIAPITSKIKFIHPFQVKIVIQNKDGKVLLNQIRTFDKRRLGKKIATLNFETMQQVDKALKLALQLN